MQVQAYWPVIVAGQPLLGSETFTLLDVEDLRQLVAWTHSKDGVRLYRLERERGAPRLLPFDLFEIVGNRIAQAEMMKAHALRRSGLYQDAEAAEARAIETLFPAGMPRAGWIKGREERDREASLWLGLSDRPQLRAAE
jgi:hypothetical protein